MPAHQHLNEAATFSLTSFYIVERACVRVCFEMQSERPDRKSLLISIPLPTLLRLKKYVQNCTCLILSLPPSAGTLHGVNGMALPSGTYRPNSLQIQAPRHICSRY